MLELRRRTLGVRRVSRRDRRGVLLMVVLSMLALFLLLGTAFLVSSQFYATSGKEAAKMGRTTNNSGDLLERAMLQVLRDTNNPNSAIRYHSLLRDVYGSDGFVGQVLTDLSRPDLMPRYAGANGTNLLGPTSGQLLELFVYDPIAPNGRLPDDRDVVKLERAPDGTTIDHNMATANDYYAGCVFTMLTGPAAGQSARIVDSAVVEYINDASGTPRPVTRLRVMVFPQANGAPLNVGGPGGFQLPELMRDVDNRVGHAFMVNGRAHNGTGVGYNRLAEAGEPRLNAMEVMLDPSGRGVPLDAWELALTPNSRFMNPFWYNDATLGASVSNIGIAGLRNYQPFGYQAAGDQLLYTSYEGPGGSDESYDAVDYQNMFLAHMPLTPRARGGLLDQIGATYDLESQEALQLINNTSTGMRLDMENTIVPSFHRPALMNYWYHRLLNAPWLVNSINDENERALAILQPYELGGPGNAIADQIVALKRKISLRPIVEDHPNFDGSNPASRYGGTLLQPSDANGNATMQLALNGQIRFPAWEVVGPWDVDNDNDGINDSVWVDLGDPVQETENGTLYKPLYAFLIVDLDNRLNLNAHGSVDHFANTQFDPTLLVTGNVGNLAAGEQFALGNVSTPWSSNVMPVGMGWGPGDISLRSILSPLTQPYSANYVGNLGGSTPYDGTPVADDYARLLMGRLPTDLQSDAIWGRLGSLVAFQQTIGLGLVDAIQSVSPGFSFDNRATPAVVEAIDGNLGFARDAQLPYEFIGYPVADRLRSARLNQPLFAQPSAFGSSPDLRGRYATGVDYTGQPVYEAVWDGVDPTNLANSTLMSPLVDDSQYETYLSSDGRRGVPSGLGGNDDALFATSEMERVLRAYDSETGTAPSRLYDIVDAFDPNKYVLTVTSSTANPRQPTAEELALAQANTAINRRQVTTDSYEIPVPADVVPGYITELGPDGVPGNLGDDDGKDSDFDGNNAEDVAPFKLINPAVGNQPAGEIGWYALQNPRDPSVGLVLAGWSDDFASLTGKSVAEARLVDVLWYRIQRHRAKQFEIDRETRPYNWNNPDAVAILNGIAQQLLPPEVLAGYKMDINRPFGDGRDNNGNGIVDEPAEGGEPWADTNGDGIWQAGEPFIDLNGDLRFTADVDDDGIWNPSDAGIADRIPTQDTNGDGVINNNDAFGPVVDNLWEQQLGAPALVDNVMSNDVTGRVFTATGVPLRDDFHLARQLYARHLYVMTLLLSDEDYLAPYDGHDAQVRRYLRLKAKELETTYTNAGMATNLAKEQSAIEAQRRYTCRQIAQWSANCVDFRDSDATNTPFEYDECPWDGWNCRNDVNNTPNDPTDDEVYPIDSDPGTDENFGQRIDWEFMVDQSTSGQKVITVGLNTANPPDPQADVPIDDVRHRTRNLVWGAERPELLITESLAFHDTRQENLGSNTDYTQKQGQGGNDDDYDQRLRPRGSLYVELYNPWSADGQRPTELYRYRNQVPFRVATNGDTSDPDGSTPGIAGAEFEGVLLDRLSDGMYIDQVARRQRSPVWRMAVVEEFPEYRNQDNPGYEPADRYEAVSHATGNGGPNGERGDFFAYDPVAERRRFGIRSRLNFRPTDPDWDEMLEVRAPRSESDPLRTDPNDRMRMAEWQQMYAPQAGLQRRRIQTMGPDGMTAATVELEQFTKPYPYYEREFYFTSGDQFFAYAIQPAQGQFGRPQAIDVSTGRTSLRSYTNLTPSAMKTIRQESKLRIPYRYVVTDWNGATPVHSSLSFRFVAIDPLTEGDNVRRDVRIAPILPGRYAVIGSAGTLYHDQETLENDFYRRIEMPRFITTIGRKSGTVPDDEVGHYDILNRLRRLELCPWPNPQVNQLMVGANDASLSGAVGFRRNELVMIDGTTSANLYDVRNVAAGDTTGDDQPDSLLVTPVVAIPVDNFNISEPVYGYEVAERERAQAEGQTLGQQAQTFSQNLQPNQRSPVANVYGEGQYVDSASASTHFDMPFDVSEEFQREGTVPNYRMLHLQRLADPTMPWNPPPGYNSHRTDDVTGANGTYSARHDPNLPVNPYLTVDSSSVDLTVFNGTDTRPGGLAGGGPANRGPVRFKSKERGELITQLRAVWGQEPASTEDSISQATVTGPAAAVGPRANFFNYVMDHTLGLANKTFGDTYFPAVAGQAPLNMPAAMIDPTDVDGNPSTFGSASGAPRPDDTGFASTYPWLAWNNRPFVSESEMMQVPAWSSSTMLRNYSVMDPSANVQINAYVSAGPQRLDSESVTTGPMLTALNFNQALANPNDVNVFYTNQARFVVNNAPFGNLQNLLESATGRATTEVRGRVKDQSGAQVEVPVPIGAANFHRVLDYVHTPSRFVATDTLLNPTEFSKNTVIDPLDPRVGLLAPFNRVPDYREPGKVNLNTIVGQRLPAQEPGTGTVPGIGLPLLWSDVYDGMMHRVRDLNVMNGAALQTSGHFGPAWRDVVLSRRGYNDPLLSSGTASGVDRVELVLDNSRPTFFANPFRSAGAGDLVPLANLGGPGIDASMLRPHPIRPGQGMAWGTAGRDDDGNGLVDDAREAGIADRSEAAFVSYPLGTPPDQVPAPVPLFSELSFTPAVDGSRNPAMHYMPLTRLDNLSTTRSGVFAVWVTVGYFEVSPAPEVNWTDGTINGTEQKFMNQTGDTSAPPQRAMTLYNRVYPQGYQLGRELGSDTGDFDRQRAFYLIDRTRPVAFKPGEDVNVEDAVLLRRRIE